ncbi:MAG: hypothetical protein HYY84_15140 [Deltaproteobacteria bacterium]|nr:hypothetical protein [Deltaproteobacteria bacterium]
MTAAHRNVFFVALVLSFLPAPASPKSEVPAPAAAPIVYNEDFYFHSLTPYRLSDFPRAPLSDASATTELEMPPPGDQQGWASCSAWALASVLSYHAARQGLIAPRERLSARFLYEEVARNNDLYRGNPALLFSEFCKRGTWYGDYDEPLRTRGVPREATWRYAAGYSGCKYEPPSDSVLSDAARIRVAPRGFQLLGVYARGRAGEMGDPARTHEKIVAAVAADKRPLLVSINTPAVWQQGARLKDETRGNNGVWAGSTAGFNGVHGKHAVVLAGWDPKHDAYQILNSWGQGWGSGGYLWVARAQFWEMANYIYLPLVQFAVAEAPVVDIKPVEKSLAEKFASRLAFGNRSEYLGQNQFRWTIALTSGADVAAEIAKVVYRLHPSFPNPVVTVTRAESATFAYSNTGWGTFGIGIEVEFNDGSKASGKHTLAFKKPAETARPLVEQLGRQVKFANTAEPMADGRSFRWTLEMKAPEAVRAKVKWVTYLLHPTFNPRIVTVTPKESPTFALTRAGWGAFSVGIRVVFADDSRGTTVYGLSFDSTGKPTPPTPPPPGPTTTVTEPPPTKVEDNVDLSHAGQTLLGFEALNIPYVMGSKITPPDNSRVGYVPTLLLGFGKTWQHIIRIGIGANAYVDSTEFILGYGMRYYFMKGQWKPYFMWNGGLVMGGGSNFALHPRAAIGVEYDHTRKFGFWFDTGPGIMLAFKDDAQRFTWSFAAGANVRF